MPTTRDIAELLGFLPELTASGLKPIGQWSGGWKDDRAFMLPWPDYAPVVEEFFVVASRECCRLGERRDAGLLDG